ncbi:hypothetical protein NP493_1562g00007 [Ridgeia piscesae]|uniref:Secreted protein n=1 Tax=Ridgeia piscesae TaxID=27915 RepID=A0AAD9NB57_RIDPI|nr:hypothetical protein NP493_1562g00007 [Ridgeia piscesae]
MIALSVPLTVFSTVMCMCCAMSRPQPLPQALNAQSPVVSGLAPGRVNYSTGLAKSYVPRTQPSSDFSPTTNQFSSSGYPMSTIDIDPTPTYHTSTCDATTCDTTTYDTTTCDTTCGTSSSDPW